MEKTFILGVGCQKGGTSWLYQYLNTIPVVDMGFMKEYHIFDAIYVDECKRFSDNAFWQLKQAANIGNVQAVHPATLKLVEFYQDTTKYFEYFDSLYYESDEVRVVGDITPSYSALPVKALEFIKSGLEAKGFKVKVIFFMRDPFDRVWSHARMIRKRKLKNNPGYRLNHSEKELLALYDTVPFQIRTRYEKTIVNLESVFDIDDIHYEFYEDLFNEDSIKQITSFLSIPYLKPDFKEKVNASPDNDAAISDSVVIDIVDYYRATYLFVIEKFGAEKVKDLWWNSQHLKVGSP